MLSKTKNRQKEYILEGIVGIESRPQILAMEGGEQNRTVERQWGITNKQKETLAGYGCVHYLDFSDALTGVNICRTPAQFKYVLFIICQLHLNVKLKKKKSDGFCSREKMAPNNKK